MAKTHVPKIRNTLSEDETGVVYRARDSEGYRLNLRKPKPESELAEALNEEEQVAYQEALERLMTIKHPSLMQVQSGGVDPKDELPFLCVKPVDGVTIAEKIKDKPLSVQVVTTLLTQLLEACDIVSHLLGKNGVWIECAPENILMSGEGPTLRFVFWPSPLKAVRANSQAQDFHAIADLTEVALDWKGREVDEREGGHIQLWLKWLKHDSRDADIHEVREMLAAAAGVEPPITAEQLVAECKRKPSLLTQMPKLPELMKLKVPRMPLFTILVVMFVIQIIIGWSLVRQINDSTDDRLQQLNSDYWSTPYTIQHDPNRANERGSQPVEFD